MNTYRLDRAIVALLSSGLAILVGAAISHSLIHMNTRIFDGILACPLILGSYCGISALHEKRAAVTTRAVGLIGAIVCTPYAIMLTMAALLGLSD